MNINISEEAKLSYPERSNLMKIISEKIAQEHKEKLRDRVSGIEIRLCSELDKHERDVVTNGHYNSSDKLVTLYVDSITVLEDHLEETATISQTTTTLIHEFSHAIDPEIEKLQNLRIKLDNEIEEELIKGNVRIAEEIIKEASDVWFRIENNTTQIGLSFFDPDDRLGIKGFHYSQKETLNTYKYAAIPDKYEEMIKTYDKDISKELFSENEFNIYVFPAMADNLKEDFNQFLERFSEDTHKYGNVNILVEKGKQIDRNALNRSDVMMIPIDGIYGVMYSDGENKNEQQFETIEELAEFSKTKTVDFQKEAIKKNPDYYEQIIPKITDIQEKKEYKMALIESKDLKKVSINKMKKDTSLEL